MAIIAASILNADFANLRTEVQKVDNAGVDMFTLDIMDGHFVPKITFGDYVVARVREFTSLPLEAHLMLADPERWVLPMYDAGADIITFHLEATRDPLRVVEEIRTLGLHAGLALNADTEIETVFPFLPAVDLINLLAVPTGFGGQSFVPSTLAKVSRLRSELERGKLDVAIEVDGGVKTSNCAMVAEAGADILTVGTGIYHAPSAAAAVKSLKFDTAGDRDKETRARCARLLAARNLPEHRSKETLNRLRHLREALDIPETSWPIGDNPRR